MPQLRHGVAVFKEGNRISLVSERLFSSGQLLMALCSLSSATYLSAPPPQASETDLCACGGSHRLRAPLMSMSEVWHVEKKSQILCNGKIRFLFVAEPLQRLSLLWPVRPFNINTQR